MNLPHVLKKILVIEDEISIVNLLIQALEATHYKIEIANTAKHSILLTKEFQPDLILLDLGLPDQDGQELILLLKKLIQSPIIVITARGNENDKVQALDNGADDYLTKPFSILELLARMRVALRHTQKNSKIYRNGPLFCDFESYLVTLNENPIKLTNTEFKILSVLIQNTGKVVTHRNLLKLVWGPNSIEHTQYLRVYVGQLRKKLSYNENSLITTELGIGYRLEEF